MYLLSTQALADVARNHNTRIHRWADDEDLAEGDVVTSAVSFTVIKHQIEQLCQLTERALWRRLLDSVLRRFQSCSGIRPVDVDIALRAADLGVGHLETIVNRRQRPLGDLGLLVVATALEENLTFIEKPQPYHAELKAKHALTVFHP